MRQIKRWLEQHALAALSDRTCNLLKIKSLRDAKRWVRRGLGDYFRHSKPLAYIIGNQPFLDREFICQQPVLVPRWETEEWTEAISKMITTTSLSPIRILDLCAGTGCIGLSMAALLYCRGIKFELTLVDVSPDAVSLSRRNLGHIEAQLMHHKRALARSAVQLVGFKNSVSIVEADILEENIISVINGENAFDLVLSNPPYIPASQLKALPRSVKEWEDLLALDGQSEDGTFFHSRIIHLTNYLIDWDRRRSVPDPFPFLAMEIDGSHQRQSLLSIFKSVYPTKELIFRADSAGNLRVALSIQ